MSELVKKEPEQVFSRKALDERERTDGVLMMKRVHQAPLSDAPRINLPKEDDLSTADGEFGPS